MHAVSISVLLFAALMVCGMAFSLIAKKLTVPATLTGVGICTAIFIGVGWIGVSLMTTFFLLGTLVTSWKKQQKAALGLAQENSGRRTSGQVLANAGVAGLLGLLAIIFPNIAGLCLYLIGAAFSSATADTLASELGSVYGKRFYDIISWKRVPPGADGIVSLEGFVAGIAGSSVIAAICSCSGGWDATVVWIIAAGTAGNLADSFFGATLERKGWAGNDAVNLLNTIVAVIIALLLAIL